MQELIKTTVIDNPHCTSSTFLLFLLSLEFGSLWPMNLLLYIAAPSCWEGVVITKKFLEKSFTFFSRPSFTVKGTIHQFLYKRRGQQSIFTTLSEHKCDKLFSSCVMLLISQHLQSNFEYPSVGNVVQLETTTLECPENVRPGQNEEE